MKLYLFLIILLGWCFFLQAQDSHTQFHAADQSLLLMPTAYTMPKGSSSFTDYEIVVLQYAHAITDRTHLSVGTVFPFTAEVMRTLTVGAKHNYLHVNKLQAAAWMSFTPDHEFRNSTFGTVFSYGDTRASLHGAVSFVTDFDGSTDDLENGYTLMVGGINNISPRTAFMAEFISTSQVLEDEGDGLLLIGLRWKSSNLSWDLGGFRPFKDGGDIFLLPWLKVTYMF